MDTFLHKKIFNYFLTFLKKSFSKHLGAVKKIIYNNSRNRRSKESREDTIYLMYNGERFIQRRMTSGKGGWGEINNPNMSL